MQQKKYEVSFKKSALKELQSIPEKFRQRILDAVQLLAINPYTDLLPIKKLKGSTHLYRIRIQDYRVIYSIENQILKVIIIRVGHRKEVYEK